jgi:hypothetical protein
MKKFINSVVFAATVTTIILGWNLLARIYEKFKTIPFIQENIIVFNLLFAIAILLGTLYVLIMDGRIIQTISLARRKQFNGKRYYSQYQR